MNQCPQCQSSERQVKNGKTAAGSQVYKCNLCQHKYVPEPKQPGHSLQTRQQAIRLVLDGNSQRQAARHVGVAPQSVANWLREYADNLPETWTKPATPVAVAEQDELFTFIGDKKTKSTS